MAGNAYRESRVRGVKAHILVVREVLGRRLPRRVQVHHFNGDKSDNRRRNLVVCEDATYHALLHRRQRALRECGHADWVRCAYCKTYGPTPDPLRPVRGRPGFFYHKECAARARARYPYSN